MSTTAQEPPSLAPAAAPLPSQNASADRAAAGARGARRPRRGTPGNGRGGAAVEGLVRTGPNGGESSRGGRTRGTGSSGRGRGRGGAASFSGRPAVESDPSTANPDSTLNGPDLAPAALDRAYQRSSVPRSNGQASATNRRAKFNAALSSSNHLSASSSAFLPPSTGTSGSTTPVASPANQTLLERLTTELTEATAECLICFSSLTQVAQISSCTTCFTAFHLGCIEKWATRSCVESAERAAVLASRTNGNRLEATSKEDGTWRCPACQSTSTAAEIPSRYTCFCTRTKNPQLRLPITPHSCGKQCIRSRPDGCKHACALLCHPGPCPSCSVVLTEPCHCGKRQLAVRCSAIYAGKSAESQSKREERLACHSTCDKMLECGLHRCARECHAGPCGGCEIVREKRCFCGEGRVEEMCGAGERERIDCFVPHVGGTGTSWEGEFSCVRLCQATYDCKNHSCQLPCHPHTSATPLPCPFSPDSLAHCPCTQTPLTVLLPSPRTSCLDPIPTCAQLCPKLLNCGHACSQPCHLGECEDCTQMVATVCRCGAQKTTRRCASGKDTGEEPFLCEKVCRAMRNCGRHECGKKCCQLSFQEALKSAGKGKGRRRGMDALEGVDVFSRENDPEGIHTCERICGRALSCGIHTCGERDHKGACGTCLLANFDELICHCGSTILLPPIACNTTIDCRHPCIRPSACGHPQMAHACHEDVEGCPPCPFLTTKKCACGKKEVLNVRCASKVVSCGMACGKLLKCGFHRCKMSCHATGTCAPCSQVCLKPLRHCTHPCPLDCHAPSTCPTSTPCQFMIEVTCVCGHLKQKTKCASCDEREEGNRERKVKCTDACGVHKRNTALAEALGIEQRERKVREVEYDAALLSFYSDHPVWCNALETTLIEFVNGDSLKAALHLPVMKRPQRTFAHELAELFELRGESLDEEPRRSIMIYRQSTSSVPTPSLAIAYALKKSSAQLNFGSLRKTTEEKAKNVGLNAILLEGVRGEYDETGLKGLLKPIMRGQIFRVEWTTFEDVLLIPSPAPFTSTSSSAQTALVTSLLPSLEHLRESTGFCKGAVEGGYFNELDKSFVRGGNWTSVSREGSGAATPVMRNGGAGGRDGWGGNRFEALGEGAEKKREREKIEMDSAATAAAVLASSLVIPTEDLLPSSTLDDDVVPSSSTVDLEDTLEEEVDQEKEYEELLRQLEIAEREAGAPGEEEEDTIMGQE